MNGTPDVITFDSQFLQKLTGEKYTELVDLVEELQNAGTLCGHPFNHPLAEVTATSYSQAMKSQSLELISSYISLLDQLVRNRKLVCEKLKIKVPVSTKEQDVAIVGLIKALLNLPDTPGAIIQTGNVEQTLGSIIGLAKHGISRDQFRAELLNDFRKEILQHDADATLAKWRLASEKWFLPKWLEQNKLLKPLNSVSKSGKVSKEKVIPLLELVIQYQKEQAVLDENAGMLSQMLEFLWNGGNSDWKNLIFICESVIRIHQALISISKDPINAKEIRSQLASQLSDGAKTYQDINKENLQAFVDLFEKTSSVENQLTEILGIDFRTPLKANADWSLIWKENALRWKDNIDSLRDWSSWNLAVEKARRAELSLVIENYRNGKLKNEEVIDSFRKGVYRLSAEFIISSDANLSAFNGKLFETKIRKYKEKTKYFGELTKAELFSKLASSIPSFTQEASQSSEIGILQRAIRNKGRGMSVRKLFDLIPNLLPRLCPCMLMSPISVAQYFDVDQSKFDLVVFDEASQMPTCEAVGAIARGKNVIVVGDPKQMPPTNFFSTTNFDEENAEKEDLESILDDCLALSIPSKHLLWHYRSKHESLIAFSNSNYYDNKLLTFPSPDDLATKVNNVHVPGFYDRGKTRQNRFEATAIVEEVIRRLSDPVLSQRSIGIVTFSSAQQNLIDDLLNEALKLRPDLDAIASESSEPIFIKNLENVQGDERDVILFSMGYGPDKEGRISLNFGPLNREGGWRRLNVAVSRARYEMKVYSTLRSDQIDITRTTSEGVAGIKAFLEYSEKGKMVLSQKDYSRKSKTNSFEKLVADEIQKLGYSVHTDIGCSGYRIDLGIVNPEKPKEYLLGILTDGENYKSAKTARDREVVRADVLRLLGWNIYKLWSPDWWDNPQKVLQDIITTIKEVQRPKEKDEIDTSIENQKSQTNRDQFAEVKLQGITQHIIVSESNYTKYCVCTLSTSCLSMSDEFFNPQYLKKIKNQILYIVQTEGPISSALLSKRILNAWGISRLGVRLNEFLNGVYDELNLKKTRQKGVNFYWNPDQEPELYKTFRIPRNDEEKRNAEDLPKEEIAAAIVEILKNQISLPAEDLIKETARLFGYARLGGNVEQAMKMGIEFALAANMITHSNDRLVLP